MKLRALALLATLGLAGCATLSGEQCRTARWEETGRTDGRRGQRPEQIEAHREACARYGVEPKADEWLRGYQQGVGEFCTPAGGYSAGRASAGDVSLCAGRPGQPEFLAAHQHGGEVFALLRQVREMYRELRIAVADRPSEAVELRNSEFVKTLKRREAWLKQRDHEFCEKYGVEPLDDADFDPDSLR